MRELRSILYLQVDILEKNFVIDIDPYRYLHISNLINIKTQEYASLLWMNVYHDFQAHHRNISSVSDISVTIDPIKREDGDEIKVRTIIF